MNKHPTCWTTVWISLRFMKSAKSRLMTMTTPFGPHPQPMHTFPPLLVNAFPRLRQFRIIIIAETTTLVPTPFAFFLVSPCSAPLPPPSYLTSFCCILRHGGITPPRTVTSFNLTIQYYKPPIHGFDQVLVHDKPLYVKRCTMYHI